MMKKSVKKTLPADMSLTGIDYKDAALLRRFLNSQGKIYAPKRYGLSAKTQRAVAAAVKRARFMGLLPYMVR